MDTIFEELRTHRRQKEQAFFRAKNVLSYRMPNKTKYSLLDDFNLSPSERGSNTSPPQSLVQHAESRLRQLKNFHENQRYNDQPESRVRHQTLTSHRTLRSGFDIRIFEISPGQFDDPLSGQFEYASIEDPHLNYEALSYVWGSNGRLNTRFFDPKSQDPTITCNGQDLVITRNLDVALRNLRCESEVKRVWVDALCINQHDNKERSHQVSIMGSIYRRATKVVIWLGTPASVYETYRVTKEQASAELQAEKAFTAICYLVNKWQGEDNQAERAEVSLYRNKRKYCGPVTASNDQVGAEKFPQWLERARYHYLGDDNICLEDDVDEAENSPFWQSICALYDCPWFWRLWVIQEVVLASDAVVRLHGSEISWKWLGLAAAILKNSFPKICEFFNMAGVYNAYLIYRMSAICDLPPIKPSFVQLIRMTRQFDVTDPRDRVYGLLGMETVDNNPAMGKLWLLPDYTISPDTLWKKVFWMQVSASGDLSLLNSVQFSITSKDEAVLRNCFDDVPSYNEESFDYLIQELPSWIPRWDIIYRSTLVPWAADDFFEASKGMSLTLHDERNPDCLCIDGIEVGTIGYLTSEPGVIGGLDLLDTDPLSEFFRCEQGLELLARTLVADKNEHGLLLADHSRILADFAAYILARAEKRPFFADIILSDQTFSNKLKTLASKGDPFSYEAAVSPVCNHRQVFFSTNGFIGIGPDCVQEGDIVAILSGVQTPFILRPTAGRKRDEMKSDLLCDMTNLPEGEHHVIVGECFIPQLMMGEAVTALQEDMQLDGPVPLDMIATSILEDCDHRRQVWSYRGGTSDLTPLKAAQMVSTIQEHARKAKLTKKIFKII